TEEIAEESNLKLDFVGFEKEMAAQKERARSARSKEQSMGVQSNLLTDIKVASEYIGYTTLEIEAKLEVILKDETVVDQCSEGKCQLIFSKTPFYAEMGGQVADTGLILSQDGKMKGKVTDVQRAPNGQNLHEVHLNETLEVGQVYVLQVDQMRHKEIIKNHTATHMLHKALKEVLGTHANQAGSLVAPNYLRFDFTHFGEITREELQKMEHIVNEKIWEAIPVVTVETDIDTAKNMGA